MPEVRFTIDPKTGQLELRVQGMAGPACDDVAKLAHELLGQPAQESETAEYFVRPAVRPQIRSEQGR
jgi:hypothetical protein